jgi:hypothetical protein
MDDDPFQRAVRLGLMCGISELTPGAMLPRSVYVMTAPGPNGRVMTDQRTTDRAEANRWATEAMSGR